MISTFNNDLKWLARMAHEVQDSYFVPEGGLHTCLDIGMNLGAFSLLHANKFDHIWGFEPAYETHDKARKLLSSFDVTNVMTYQLAVTGESGQCRDLYQPKKHSRSGNARLGTEGRAVLGTEKVFTISINDVFELIDYPTVDYLKLDVEGAEQLILPAVDLGRFTWIAIEIHGWASPEACRNILRSNGFKLKYGNENVGTWLRE